MMTLADFFRPENYPLRVVVLGCGALGLVSGALGAFAVLRKQSLLGDAISHAALPGVALAFLLTQTKEPVFLLTGAALASWLGTLLVMVIVRYTRIKYDAALGVMLSVFFGVGLVVLTYIQNHSTKANQAGLRNFLFGQAGTLLLSDVIVIVELAALVLLVLALFWKEFKLLSFDPDYAATLGYPIQLLDVLLTTLLVIAIVTGLQAVGAVLMSALIIAPAAAARQWTDRLGVMVVLAGLFGATAGVAGGLLGDLLSVPPVALPTGPLVVLCVSAIVIFSLLLAPNRGLVWNGLREMARRRQLQLEAILDHLYQLSLQHESLDHGHPFAVVRSMAVGQGNVLRSLKELEARGWARRTGPSMWAITEAGLEEARRRRIVRQQE
ncbi:MAG: hypothetical protein KatS3mg105_0877 [Gemmatales bacterium]|nr:MAG: hypothetical protein KatS3mg105_0877 [Gemmatales bacterium]